MEFPALMPGCQAPTPPRIAADLVRNVHVARDPRSARSSELYVPYNREMTVTVKDIVAIPGMPLRLLAGEQQADRPIRWVHVSELEDPTPWLKGGELILTTGLGIGSTPAKHRAYVDRLIDAGLTGLGFGPGFTHDKVPRSLISAASKAGFPLFEVPYPVPFIAITEAIFTRIAAEQLDTLQRAVDAEHVLTRAVMEGAGVDGIARSLADVTKGWALLFDLHGQPIASSGRAASLRAERIWQELRTRRAEGTSFSVTLVDRGHHIWVQPVGARGRVEAFLAVGKADQPTQLDQIVAGHALSLFAIEMAKSRAVADAQRRLQGDFFDDLARGALPAAEASRGLARFGFDKGADVVVLSIEVSGEAASGGTNGSVIDPETLAVAVSDGCSREGGGFLVSVHDGGVHLLLPAEPWPDLDRTAALGERVGASLRVGAGSRVTPVEVGASLRGSRYALQVCRLEGWTTAGFADLGTYRLLLSMAEPDALRAFTDSALMPLDMYDRDHDGDLLVSLAAFLGHNARWESAAEQLFVHRHTLRYRMRKVEELTGRDLSSSFDRMELWIALRARELQEVQAEA
jgi:PucR family transcriptional regulator, purine catabolism regulatory protein